jgi:dihydrofolate reductase
LPDRVRGTNLTLVAKLVYAAITSLDGYVADDLGNFDWAEPDEEVFIFVNDLERRFGTNLYGRRMYETMVYWETFDASRDPRSHVRDFAMMWRAANKIVYSTTLNDVISTRTRIDRAFDAGAVRQMKQESDHDISIGGANLASQAIREGLVDEMHLFVTPVTVGGGTSAHPDHFRSQLQLQCVDRFASGVVHLQYLVNN